MNFYEGGNKDIAMIEVEGFSDDSAPRESNRQLQMLNVRLNQLIALQLMEVHKCPSPKHTSSGIAYSIQALQCQTEKIKGNYTSEKCDTSKWKSILDKK